MIRNGLPFNSLTMNYPLEVPHPPLQSWLSLLRQHRVIAVIRSHQMELAHQMARSVAAGGLHLIEITWNSDRPAELIRLLREELPGCVIGAGTILNQEQLRDAIAAGAQFLFTPHVDSGLIQTAVDREVPIVPGALTPTEIVRAWQAGASSVKVFPAQTLGGPSYIRSLQGPLGQIPLIPTGGVTQVNLTDFLISGAIAVGLSSSLFPREAVAQQQWETIREQARSLVHHLKRYQEPSPSFHHES